MKKIILVFLSLIFVGCGTRAYFITDADESFDFSQNKSIYIIPLNNPTIQERNLMAELSKLLTENGFKITYSYSNSAITLSYGFKQQNFELTGYSPSITRSNVYGKVGKKDVEINSNSTTYNENKYQENVAMIFLTLYNKNVAIWSGAAAIPSLKYNEKRTSLLDELIKKIGTTITTDYEIN